MTFTLTGALADHGNQPLKGTRLVITPTPSVTVDREGKVVYLEGREVVTDDDGEFTVDLVAAEGRTYTVRSIAGGRFKPQRFTSPADGETVDLADVTPVPAPEPMAEYVRGASAYELAVAGGFDGSEGEWLASLKGDPADPHTHDDRYYTKAQADAAYTRKRRTHYATRRAHPGALAPATLPTTGGVNGGGGFGWQDAPIHIFKDGARYVTDFDVADFKNAGGDTWYVDPVAGSNLNDGQTTATAVQSISNAIGRAAPGSTIVLMGTGIVYRGRGLNGTAITKPVNIVAQNPGQIACATSDDLTWTAGTGNTWTASRSNVSRVVDLGIGAHGLIYTQATTAAQCQATPGSWYQDGSTLHVHTLDGTQPDNARHLALLKVQGWTVTDTSVYIEGIDIIGGEVGGNIQLTGTQPTNLYLKDVGLLHATDAAHNSLNAIGSHVRDVFSQRVTAAHSRKDGFNYSGSSCRFIEVDCHSYAHGLIAPAGPHTNNASTAHAGAKGIRIGGTYHETAGAVIADVQTGTQTLNYSVTAYDPLTGTGDLYDGAFVAQQAGVDMWAYGSTFFGSGGWDVVALSGTAVILDESSFDTRTGSAYTTVTNEV